MGFFARNRYASFAAGSAFAFFTYAQYSTGTVAIAVFSAIISLYFFYLAAGGKLTGQS